MPRTRLDKPKNEKLAVLLNGHVHKCGGSVKSAAAKLKKDYSSFSKKLNDPGKFTVDELVGFARAFNVPIEDLRAAIEK